MLITIVISLMKKDRGGYNESCLCFKTRYIESMNLAKNGEDTCQVGAKSSGIV